jgi:murein DD-endopeptidase MepM/ murein hydrolase activator NlpD
MQNVCPMRALPGRAPRAAVRATAGTAAVGVALSAVAFMAGPALASPTNDYEMPFPCGQGWTGTTRSNHSPSAQSVDWNRPDDVDDPVVAAAAGTVSVADDDGGTGYGRWVQIEHAGGESTIYAHLGSVAVAAGQTVDQGALLGVVGRSGNASGPHLHFEERRDRKDIHPWFHGAAFVLGSTLASQNCVDVPVAGNFVGTPEAEVAVYRRTARATFQVMRSGRTPKRLKLGTATDQPVVGDWDGNGRANPGVRTPATKTFQLWTPAGITSIVLGAVGDQPIAGDWDGDGLWEVGVHRAGTNDFRLRAADGTVSTVTLGDADDLPVTGDWDADGRTDLAVFDIGTATFTLRRLDGDGLVWTAQVQFGEPGDLPVAGDWDGNRATDLGVWDPATATFSRRHAASPTAARSTSTATRFGHPR